MSYLPGVYARKRIWVKTTIGYIVGSLVGGLALGTTLWVVAVPLRPLPFLELVVAAVLLVSFVRDFFWRFPILERKVQVNLHGRTSALPPVLGGFIFGVSLGTGVLTFIAFASFYVLVLGAASSERMTHALVLGASYGLGRAAFQPIVTALWPTPPQAHSIVGVLASRRSLAAAASWAGACLVALGPRL